MQNKIILEVLFVYMYKSDQNCFLSALREQQYKIPCARKTLLIMVYGIYINKNMVLYTTVRFRSQSDRIFGNFVFSSCPIKLKLSSVLNGFRLSMDEISFESDTK